MAMPERAFFVSYSWTSTTGRSNGFGNTKVFAASQSWEAIQRCATLLEGDLLSRFGQECKVIVLNIIPLDPE